jgi:hypothetical protein
MKRSGSLLDILDQPLDNILNEIACAANARPETRELAEKALARLTNGAAKRRRRSRGRRKACLPVH